MQKKIPAEKYPMISACCLGGIAILRLIEDLVYALQYNFFSIFNIHFIIPYIVTIGLPILIYKRKNDTSLVLIGIVGVVLGMENMVYGFCISNVLFFIRNVLLLLLFLFTCYPPLQSKKEIAEKYWNFPALVSGIAAVITVSSLMYDVGLFSLISISVTGTLDTVGLLFLGLWLTRGQSNDRIETK